MRRRKRKEKKEKSLFIVLRHLSADRKKRRSRKILTKKKKKIRNQPQWKYEGVTFKKKENGRHRLTRGSEKTGQCGRWGRAGPRPLRLEKLVQVKMKQERLLCLEPKRSWGLRGRDPSRSCRPGARLWKQALLLNFEAASAPFRSIPAPLQSQGANLVSWGSQTSAVSPPGCCRSLLGRRALWGLLDIFRNSIKQPCEEKPCFPIFCR